MLGRLTENANIDWGADREIVHVHADGWTPVAALNSRPKVRSARKVNVIESAGEFRDILDVAACVLDVTRHCFVSAHVDYSQSNTAYRLQASPELSDLRC
jgi:hypothetical protein